MATEAQYIHRCSTCGHVTWYKSYADYHNKISTPGGDLACDTCQAVFTAYPGLFEWVQSVIQKRLDEHTDNYAHKSTSTCPCCS